VYPIDTVYMTRDDGGGGDGGAGGGGGNGTADSNGSANGSGDGGGSGGNGGGGGGAAEVVLKRVDMAAVCQGLGRKVGPLSKQERRLLWRLLVLWHTQS
jgi:hypothetical protein